jgi:chemotaxis protein MotB
VRSNIDVIAIQGHTDDRGSPAYNRKLSAERANAVLDFMFSAESELGERYGRYFAASAFSEFRPIAEGDTAEAYQKNRRIELSVVLRDSRVRDVIDTYLRGHAPGLHSSPEPAASGTGAPPPEAP